MAKGHWIIECTGDGENPMAGRMARVFHNGEEVHGVCDLMASFPVDGAATLFFAVHPSRVDIKGDDGAGVYSPKTVLTLAYDLADVSSVRHTADFEDEQRLRNQLARQVYTRGDVETLEKIRDLLK